MDENGDPTGIEGFDHFSDDYDIMGDFAFPGESDDNASDWEFVGFGTQPDLFDKYASNPPAEELEEIW